MDNTILSNLTFRDFLRPIFRKKLLVILSCAIIIPLTYIGLKFQTPLYEARVLIHIKGITQIESSTYGNIGPFRIHLTQMTIVKSNPVIKRAVKALNLEKQPLNYEASFCHPLKKIYIDYKAKKEEEYIASLKPEIKDKYLLWRTMTLLKSNIKTALQPGADVFQIVVQDFDSQKTVEIANVVSRSYVIYDLQQQLAEQTLKYGDLHPTVQQLYDNITKMEANLNGKEVSDLESIGTASVKIIEQASTDYQPVGKPKSLIMLIGLLISGFIGLALAFIFDMLDNTLKTPDGMVRDLNLPHIGSIPKKGMFSKQLLIDASSKSLYMDFFDDLTDQLYIFMKVKKLKTLLFISISNQSANIPVVANIGFCLSRNSDVSTLMIEGNSTKPALHKLLGLDEKPGLAEILEDNTINAEGLIHNVEKNLNLLPMGTIKENTAALLNGSSITPLIKKIKSKYEGILIDCANVKKLSDITVLLSSVDGVVVIINEGKDHIQATRNILHSLKSNKVNIIGGIFNSRTFPIPQWLYKRV